MIPAKLPQPGHPTDYDCSRFNQNKNLNVKRPVHNFGFWWSHYYLNLTTRYFPPKFNNKPEYLIWILIFFSLEYLVNEDMVF